MISQQEIQEQAEKLLQASPDLVDERSFMQGFLSCAQWMQEREKSTFLGHVNSLGLSQKDKDLIKGVYYEFLSLPSPPKD